jgi:hypothetical protein
VTAPKPATVLAPACAWVQHGDWLWTAFQVGAHRYDVYRYGVSIGRREFIDSYRTRFFAKRRCKRGNP